MTKPLSIPIPSAMAAMTCPLSLEGNEKDVKALMETCEKALAQAEADKPRRWDFGIIRGQSTVRIRSITGWSSSSDPGRYKGIIVEDCHVHILGNLADIVTRQGPIVVGLPYDDARALTDCRDSLREDIASRLYDKLQAALARYEKEKA